jgi:hypothetical protein
MTISTYSQKKEWTYYNDTPSRDGYYKVNSKNTVWIMEVYKDDLLKWEEKIVRKSISLLKIDCDKKLLGALSTTLYDEDDKLIVSDSYDERDVKMNYIIPGSRSETDYKMFCNKK